MMWLLLIAAFVAGWTVATAMWRRYHRPCLYRDIPLDPAYAGDAQRQIRDLTLAKDAALYLHRDDGTGHCIECSTTTQSMDDVGQVFTSRTAWPCRTANCYLVFHPTAEIDPTDVAVMALEHELLGGPFDHEHCQVCGT